ncbi:MAG: hypothetical protein IKW99_09900 [Bacteroidales bacterium]|nr:hypothetical protein [Bacteroidales bacterium]
MDRKDLIKLYLEAETTCEQERELADSFTVDPPSTDEEMAVYSMMRVIKPIQITEHPEAGEEFDRMVRPSRVKRLFPWAISLTGVAAAVAAVVLFIGKPGEPAIPDLPQDDYSELIQQIAFLSNFNPAEADIFEFKPVGDGFVMTAHFPDGHSASFILTPLDGGDSFNLISLNH